MVDRQPLPQYGNRAQVRLTAEDALGCKGFFIIGADIRELAEVVAARRNCPVEQAIAFLEKWRARDNWIEQRQAHLNAIATQVQVRDIRDKVQQITASQDATGDMLILRAITEINQLPAASRTEALRTLETGFKFKYRAAGLPHTISDPAILPRVPDDPTRRIGGATMDDQEFARDIIGRLRAFAGEEPLALPAGPEFEIEVPPGDVMPGDLEPDDDDAP